MLVLTRGIDESIIIGDNIVITVVDIRGDKVRLGIDAPVEIPVNRNEVYEEIIRENGGHSLTQTHRTSTRPHAAIVNVDKSNPAKASADIKKATDIIASFAGKDLVETLGEWLNALQSGETRDAQAFNILINLLEGKNTNFHDSLEKIRKSVKAGNFDRALRAFRPIQDKLDGANPKAKSANAPGAPQPRQREPGQ